MKNKGFTLIELLVVIGIIAILAGVVIVALNPARQFAQARNTQRWSNVNTILNAVGQRMADKQGIWKTDATCVATLPIPTVKTPIGSGVGNKDLAPCLAPTYIPSMVFDPNPAGDAADIGYDIAVDANGRVTIYADNAELTEVISVTR